MKQNNIEQLAAMFMLASLGILIPLSALDGAIGWSVSWWVSIPCAILSVYIHSITGKAKHERSPAIMAGLVRKAEREKMKTWEVVILLEGGQRVTRHVFGPNTESGIREMLKDNCDRFGHIILSVARRC